MRQAVKDFVKVCSLNLPIKDPVYEFGSLRVEGQDEYADLRPFFSANEYVGADMREGLGVDVVLNLHKIDLPANSVGTILLMDTLEHVEYLRKAMDEIYKILKPGGVLIMSSLMDFAIHDHPFDYWRFTPEAFKSLLKPFDFSIVDFAGKEDFPHTVVGIAFKGEDKIENMEALEDSIKHWKHFWRDPLRGDWKSKVKLYSPDILIKCCRGVKRVLGQ